MHRLTARPESKQQTSNMCRRRLSLLVSVQFLTLKPLRPFRPHHDGVLFLATKIASRTVTSESAAMRFTVQHTSIPVRRAICPFTHKGYTFIVGERIHGDMIGLGWKSRSAVSQAKIRSQLKEMAAEMRRIPSPSGSGANIVDGGRLFDYRIVGPMHLSPLKSVGDLHKSLRRGVDAYPKYPDDINSMA
ncbi:hypothetical protein B7494_g4665 [Chlorociboria aeruginascens]|nr:hypothetical protein B7494_g4665 [Chlorociboria aeruginascens]